MIIKISLDNIEGTYRTEIQKQLDNGDLLTALTAVEISLRLFEKLKVENISDSEDSDSDMILYQYGIYDWNDELQKQFHFDITRQFINVEEDEPYQLSFTLIYEPTPFETLKSYDCWSSDFSSLEDFGKHIKATDGFLLADKNIPKTYRLQFSQC